MKWLILFFLLLSVCSASNGFADEAKQGRITGTMMIKDNGAMSDGAVFIYDAKRLLPLPDKYFRIPDDVVLLDDEGKFSVEIAPGTYYIGGIKKKTEKGPGPPQIGDYFFISQEAAGMPKAYVVNENDTLDIGIISEAVPYKEITVTEGVTAIEGIILNGEGAPVERVVVFADITPVAGEGISFVSNWTGKDGKYFLRVHEGGTYNLIVDDFFGTGGTYGMETDAPVSVKTGEVIRRIDFKAGRLGKE